MKENAPGAGRQDTLRISAAARKEGGLMIMLDKDQRPVELLNAGNGVRSDTGYRPHRLETDCLAMDNMIKQIEFRGLKRPPPASCANMSVFPF